MVTIVAVGYASLPIVPSLRDITKTLSDQLVKPASAASKQAGDAIEKNVGQAAEKAAADVERARQKEIYVAQDVAKAEQAVEDARSKSEQAARKTKAAELDRERAVSQASTRLQKAEADYEKVLSDSTATAEQVEAAAEKVTQARLAGESDILRKENSLQKAQDESRRTAEQVEAASRNLSDQRLRSEDAADNLVAAEVRLEKAQSESADGLKDWTLSAEDAEQASRDLESAQKGLEVGIAAAAGAVVAAMGGLFSIGKDFHGMSREIAIGSGASGDALRDLEESAMSVAQTVPVSFEESANALAGLNTTTGETGPALEALTSQVLEASNLLGEDGVSNANSFGNALAQWEIDAATGADAMDGLFTVTQNYGIGLNEVTGHLNTYGSVLNNAGFEMEEAAVLFGSLDRAGLAVSRIMPGLNSAFRGWASENKDVQAELAKTVGLIESAETSQEALAIATDEFGAEGAQRLTTAIRNGSFALDDFDTALGDTEGAIARTAEENRTLEESFQLVKNEALVAIEPLAREFFDQLVPAVELAGEKFTEMVAWVQENEGLVKGLASAIGGMAGGLMVARGAVIAFEAAMRIKNVALLVAQGGWKGLNTAMRGNIIVLIATAVAGLVAGLIYFFRETEKGQEIWAIFTEHLGAAWDWVVDKLTAGWEWIRDHVLDPFMDFAQETLLPIWEVVLEAITDAWEWLAGAMRSAWENVLQPTFSAIADIAVWLWENVLQNVFKFILGYWKFMIGAMKLAWENILRPTFEVLAKVATWLWENVLSPTFDFIGRAWDQLLTVMKWAWENILRPTFEVLGDVAVWLAENVLAPAFDFIGNAWEHLSTAIKWAWENLIKPAWEALQNAATWMYEKVLEPVFKWIGDRWSDMGDTLDRIGTWINDNVFVPMGDAVNTVKGWFETAVDGIGKAWENLKELTAKPINFVIEFVYGSVKKAWDAVAGLVDLPELPTINKIGGYAEGTARVPGVRTRHDNVHMVSTDGRFGLSLRGDEGVLVPEAVDGLGESTVNDLNRLGLTQGKAGVDRYLEHRFLGGFDQGGFVGPIRRQTPFFGGAVSDVQRSQETFVERFFPGVFTLTSATRPGDSGHHGSGLATDWQDSGAQWPTPNSKALSRAIATNFPHTLELIHWPNDGWPNISNGQPYDFGSPTNEQHANHVHWATQGPVVFDGDDIRLDGGGAGGGVWESITSTVKRIWDGIIGSAPSYKDEPDAVGGLVGDMPGKFLTRLAGAAWDWVKEKADAIMGFFGGGSGGAEQWRELSRTALRLHGYDPDDHIEAMLAQIDIESGGDPTAVNDWDINAVNGTPSGGLLQVIEPTYQDVRRLYPEAFEGLPDDRFHPLTNLTAGVGAVRRDWGGPAGRWPTTAGYHLGGLAPEGRGWMAKTALEPEMVLNPDMTQAFIDWMRGTPHGESAAVVARELAEAFAGVLGDDSDLVTSIRDFSRIVDEQSKIDWDTRLQSLEDHLAGIEANEDGEREQVRGRIGRPDEIALWAGTEIAEQFANEALGLIGLDGLVDLPRHLDDDLRVPFEQQSTPEDTAADSAAAETVSGQAPSRSVADQAAESGTTGVNQASTIEVNVTFNNVDPNNVDELRSMVDELADKVARAANGRRDAVAVSRGASI